MEFWKINGNGNDFVTIDVRGQNITDAELSETARRVCRRRRSIGADGLLVLGSSSTADFRMRIFNSDGSEGEMCGNGSRCIARYAFERGAAPAVMSFETIAGLMKARVQGSYVETDLGRLTFEGGWTDREMDLEGTEFRSAFLRVGVPHLVLLTMGELPDRETMTRLGRKLRYDTSLFPQGTNVSFFRPADRGELEAVTYERGVEDLTDSCGTGCTACSLTAHLMLSMPSPIVVHNPGGDNRITFEQLSKFDFNATLGGKTCVVARGTVGEEA